jgi:hypothetical protein
MRLSPFRRLVPVLSVLALLGAAAWSAGTLAAPATTLQSDWRGRLAPLLPQAGQPAQVMETRAKVSLTEIRRRVLDLGGNPQVLEQVLISVQRGAVPEYDSKINISKTAYQKILSIQQTLHQSGRVVKIGVQFSGNRLTFVDLGGTPLLRGISLDLSSGEMRFPEGFSAQPVALSITAAEAAKADDPIGKRSGYVWKVLGSNPTTFTALKGSFFLLALSDGSVLVSYNRSGILNGRSGTGNLILNFSPVGLPASSVGSPR